MIRRTGVLWLAMALAAPACALESAPEAAAPVAPMGATADEASAAPVAAEVEASAGSRSGREIYQRFREGLAEPGCDGGASSARWRAHFAHAPRQLATHDGDVLPFDARVRGEKTERGECICHVGGERNL